MAPASAAAVLYICSGCGARVGSRHGLDFCVLRVTLPQGDSDPRSSRPDPSNAHAAGRTLLKAMGLLGLRRPGQCQRGASNPDSERLARLGLLRACSLGDPDRVGRAAGGPRQPGGRICLGAPASGHNEAGFGPPPFRRVVESPPANRPAVDHARVPHRSDRQVRSSLHPLWLRSPLTARPTRLPMISRPKSQQARASVLLRAEQR